MNLTKQEPSGSERSQRVSLSMIVRNEEHFLAGCLESVKGIVDEIVIVDTGSTDRTLEIAGQFGARIFHFEWIGDFSAARNESLKHCTGDWILYLDADERLSAESRELLPNLVKDQHVKAYYCLLRGEENLPRGRVFNIARYPRLFRRAPEFRFESRVHEQILPSIRRAGYEPVDSQLAIDHLGYAQSSGILAAKFERNVRLLREQVASQPGDPYVRFQLGNTLAMLGRPDEAMAEMREALAQAGTVPKLKATILNGLSSLCADEGRIEEGIVFAEESLRIASSQVTARWLLATLRMCLQDFDAALPVLLEMLRVQQDPNRGVSVDVGFDASIPLHEVFFRVGLCYYKQGLIEDAAHAYFHGLNHSIGYRDMLDRYLNCVDQLDGGGTAIPQLEWLAGHGTDSVPLLNSLARCKLKAGDLAGAEEILRRCSGRAFNGDTLGCWIQYYMQAGNVSRAADVYREATAGGADTPFFHRSALQFALANKDMTAALVHLEGMAKGVFDAPVEFSRFVSISSTPPGAI